VGKFWRIARWVIGVGLIVLIICGGGAAFLVPTVMKLQKEASEKARGSAVVVERAAFGEITRVVSAPGALAAKNIANISARVSAKIEEIPHGEGERVNQGQMLVRLDAKELEASLAAARARYLADEASFKSSEANLAAEQARIIGARAQYQNAVIEFERQQQLFESGDVSKSSLDAAKTEMDRLSAAYEGAQAGLDSLRANVEAAKARVEASRADVDRAQRNVEYTVISAPYDGVVTRKIANVGEVALGTISNQGATLLVVEDQSEMLVKSRLAEMDAPRVKPGQKCRVFVNGYPERTFNGVLRKVGLTVLRHNDGTLYFEGEILLDTEGERLASGTTANVEIEIETIDKHIVIPSQAVQDKRVDSLPQKLREENALVDREKTFCRVVYVRKDGKAMITPVTTVASSLTRTAIKEGLEEGVEVIVGPFSILQNLADGSPVRVLGEEAEKKDKKSPEDETAVAEGDGKTDEGSTTDDSATKKTEPASSTSASDGSSTSDSGTTKTASANGSSAG